MTKDEALNLALEALEAHADIGIKSDYVITAIKEALAQPKPCEYCYGTGDVHSNDGEWRGVCICEIGKALAQPEQEPVGDFYITKDMAEHIKNLEVDWTICASGSKRPTEKKVVPVFVGNTTPPQRPSRSDIKPLTDEQTIILKGTTCPEIDWKARHGVEMNNGERNKWMLDWFMAFKVAIEAAHGIKENT